MAALAALGKFKNTGLLIIRLGLGAMFVIVHGYPKIMGGPGLWETIGRAMGNLGVDFFATFWGFVAALAETIGGIFIALGLLFRPTAFVLALIMLVAAMSHLANGAGLFGAAHPIEVGIVLLGLALVGPGKYSVDKR